MKIDTRTRILETTWRQLEDAPGADVRMADIAKAAGISRQALYLHFPTRAALLTETTHHIDDKKEMPARFAACRNAADGLARLDAFIDAWCNYIPEIYGVGRALMALSTHDEAAREAWADRMDAVREGCAATVNALADDGLLAPHLTRDTAADLLRALLSVEVFALLTIERGWSQANYVAHMKDAAGRTLSVALVASNAGA